MVVVIGPNGAGKSTLAKAIFGLVKVREGHVTLMARTSPAPRPTRSPPRHELRAAGRERLRLPDGAGEPGGRRRPAPRGRRARIEAMMTLFPRLGERRRQRAGHALRRRAPDAGHGARADARASVLLLDEPSAGLAPRAVGEVFETVADINGAGVTIVMIEQNARRALALGRPGLRAGGRPEPLRGRRRRAAHRSPGGRALPGRSGTGAAGAAPAPVNHPTGRTGMTCRCARACRRCSSTCRSSTRSGRRRRRSRSGPTRPRSRCPRRPPPPRAPPGASRRCTCRPSGRHRLEVLGDGRRVARPRSGRRERKDHDRVEVLGVVGLARLPDSAFQRASNAAPAGASREVGTSPACRWSLDSRRHPAGPGAEAVAGEGLGGSQLPVRTSAGPIFAQCPRSR